MRSQLTIDNISQATSKAVALYWATRKAQQEKQKSSEHVDQGARSAVTGGAQMSGFIQLFTRIISEAGMDPRHIHFKSSLELPGFFRPTKEWDLLVVKKTNSLQLLRPSLKLDHLLETILTTELKKQWEARWIYGLLTEKGHFGIVLNHFSAIFSCLKTLQLHSLL